MIKITITTKINFNFEIATNFISFLTFNLKNFVKIIRIRTTFDSFIVHKFRSYLIVFVFKFVIWIEQLICFFHDIDSKFLSHFDQYFFRIVRCKMSLYDANSLLIDFSNSFDYLFVIIVQKIDVEFHEMNDFVQNKIDFHNSKRIDKNLKNLIIFEFWHEMIQNFWFFLKNCLRSISRRNIYVDRKNFDVKIKNVDVQILKYNK